MIDLYTANTSNGQRAAIMLADREFLAGEVSIADFALYPIVVTRRPLIDRAGNLRHLTRWAAALAQQGMAAAA